MTLILTSTLVLATQIATPPQPAAASDTQPLSILSVFNPTAWKGPLVVEVPTGRIAAPGLLDWRCVRLRMNDQTVPFAIRSRWAHRGMCFGVPASAPRAEDLLVFTCAVPPGQWVRVHVWQAPSAQPDDREHLVRENDRCTITYPGLKAVIDEADGRLRELSYRGESLITGPLGMEVATLSQTVPYEFLGAFGPGYADPADRNAPTIKVNRSGSVPCQVQRVSALSSAAMTEFIFSAEVRNGPLIELTYRIHPNGVVEILADSQGWLGISPWCSHAAAYTLPLIGKPEVLDLMEDRFAFYGFKGYAAAVKQTACIRRGAQVGLIEIGEETVNGRRWMRRLLPYGLGDNAMSLVEAADEDSSSTCCPCAAHRSAGR